MRRLLASLALATLAAAQPVVTASGETMRLKSSSVVPSGSAWAITLTMNDDNGNPALGTSFRRWWHCQIAGLRTQGETLQVKVDNAGYSDVILPVWSLSADGQTFGEYARVPASALPSYASGAHTFTLVTPPGTVALRLAKFFPYSVTRRDLWLAGFASDGRVRSVTSLGTTALGRSIPCLELTDPAVPDAGKRRIWIHAGIHPSETTSYFTVEGLVQALLSGEPATALLLQRTIVDLVPMANPDGVWLGNYRTSSRSMNLEDLWASPYASTEQEVVALRTRIEKLMGTASSPAPNPIEVLLNLHSSHDVAYPFHFQHAANPAFNLTTSRSGVIPAVNALEGKWIAAFKARSTFASAGTTQSSTLSPPTRPFVESMLHDRWSVDPMWTGAPAWKPLVMAITFEGTYGKGPDQVSWCTPDDYRACGRAMAKALADYFGVLPGGSAVAYGPACGPTLAGAFAGGLARLDLLATSGPPGGPAALALGVDERAFPLPGSSCLLRTEPLVTLPLSLDATGSGSIALPLPAFTALLVRAQSVALAASPAPSLVSSNGLLVQAAR